MYHFTVFVCPPHSVTADKKNGRPINPQNKQKYTFLYAHLLDPREVSVPVCYWKIGFDVELYFFIVIF